MEDANIWKNKSEIKNFTNDEKGIEDGDEYELDNLILNFCEDGIDTDYIVDRDAKFMWKLISSADIVIQNNHYKKGDSLGLLIATEKPLINDYNIIYKFLYKLFNGLVPNEKRILNIEWICAPQQSKIGQYLMNEIKKKADDDYSVLLLHSYRKASRAYLKQGFKPVGIETLKLLDNIEGDNIEGEYDNDKKKINEIKQFTELAGTYVEKDDRGHETTIYYYTITDFDKAIKWINKEGIVDGKKRYENIDFLDDLYDVDSNNIIEFYMAFPLINVPGMNWGIIKNKKVKLHFSFKKGLYYYYY